ncbi:DAK2 domain-containing protein [Lachnoclostridium phytofermentans]|uniref:Dak phosphatase n=1 Tax=Lachnoclostridium phytofermentans (strain ATCC 700394 / DSM 18823 / ISDg) TaxID=357809 RepID=A9KPH5_LACP7|nr:DAK2 domain-containing protein [Lachnoclostridium phytofermentans]ABX43249.1 Dak phosphatase [Lachnoclostridium phytofermentans ISDg]
MTLNTIDAKLLQKMFLAGAKSIEVKKEYINELNVFPVPDGDTGTNMTLTIMSAAKEVSTIVNPTIEDLCKAISSGSLRGARGNSGVILSQLFRGLTKEFAEHKQINVIVMANAFQKAVETAYKAVMKPKEGTILTVARGGAERAAELANETTDLVYFGAEVIKRMEEVLARTPEMLPVLKEAGVVDSGGQGLLEIVKGAYDAMLGKNVDFTIAPATTSTSSAMKKVDVENIATADIKFGYCTEFIIMVEKEYNEKKEHEFKGYLESIGDSIVVVSDDDIIKVHVHTNDPGLAIQRALTYGSLTRMKIDNMREEHNERLIADASAQAAKNIEMAEVKKKEPRKPVGFVAVSIGEGINDIFSGLGVDYLIEGGQTMNPSTEDMLNAIDNVNADTIFILPNNSNIILAAEQAKALTEDKEIVVIPSKTVPQGITAIINYVYDKSTEENQKRMIEEMTRVKTGQVTYAVRDTNIDGKEIKQGNIMGIGDKTILSVGTDVSETTLDLIENLVDDDSELISLYYGAEVTEEDANQIADQITEKYPMVDVEVHMGGQPIYYYVLSVE